MVPVKEHDSVSVESLRARVTLLRAKRGVALMDGEPIEKLTAEIEKINAKADALDDLEAAKSARAYTVATAKLKEGRSSAQKELEHFVDKALAAVEEAEASLRRFAAAYKSMRSLYYACGQVHREIDGTVPAGWNLLSLNDRFGYRAGAVLSTIDSLSRLRLGHLRWEPGPYPKADASWVELETDILRRKL